MSFGLSAGVLMGGAMVGSALIGANASGKAAKAQTQAADKSDATQRYMYDQTREDNAPFRETGLDANNRLAEMMNSGQFSRKFTQADMNADPVYQNGLQFGLDQGTQGINRQAAAGGNFLSGATLKALTRFGNDYGSTKANESYNRFNNDQNSQYNRYAGLSGSGMQATNQVGAAGQNMTNGMSNALGTYGTGAANNSINAGNARASGYVGQANAVNNGLSSWLNYNQNQNMINAFGGNNGGYANMTGFQTPSAYTYPTTTSNYGALGTGTWGVN